MKLLIFRPIERILNNPSLVALILFGLTLWLCFYFVGEWMIPVIVSIILAYLMEGVITKLQRLGVRRIIAVSLVFFIFSALIVFIILAVLPGLISQSKSLITNLPSYVNLAHAHLNTLPERFPNYISQNNINDFISAINLQINQFSREILSGRIFTSLITLISLLVYIILVPILIFFMLKDKKEILSWLGTFLPKNRAIIAEIWQEVDAQIGNYIRGKFIEILVIWGMCFVPFTLFGLQYSLLLSLMVGLSVLIPYIGATLVTFPVLIVAYMQFGFAGTFWWIAIIYFIIQILDGNVIVPIIFSEAVSIHPVAIIIAILVFGGLWGFWGVFFAIPLATVVKAIIEAWRRYENIHDKTQIISEG